MACIHTKNKASINKLRNAIYDFDEKEIREVLSKLLTPDTIIHMPWPLGDKNGPDQLYKKCYEPLVASIPDLERRD